MAEHLKQAQLQSVLGHGFTSPPAQAGDAALPDKDWVDVPLPHVAAREMVPYLDETATVTDWYRLTLGAPLTKTTEPRYLYIPRWKTIGQIAIYGDGRLLYQSEGSRVHNGYNHPLLLRLNGAAGALPPATVLVRIDRLRSSGSAVSSLWVGSAQSLVWRYQVRQMLQTQIPLFGGVAFLAVGMLSFAVWLRHRGESLYLLFFALSSVSFVRTLHYYVGGNFLPIGDDWFEWLTAISLIWLIVLSHRFLERLHLRPVRGLSLALLVVTLLCSLVILPGATAAIPHLILLTPFLYVLLLPLALLVFADAMHSALRTGRREAWLMVVFFLASTLFSSYDLALQHNWVRPEGIYTQPYALIMMFLMFGYTMFRRYVKAKREEVELLNASLALRLQWRETELEHSHQLLRAVELRQTISDERQRLMQDMHDGLGSSLISAIRSVEHGGMRETEVSQILKDCMDDLKLTIDSMEPVEADLLLLLATLRFRLEPRLEYSRVALVWEVQEVPPLAWLDPSSGLNILRIVQESIANILRHTQATAIRVSTAVEGAGVQVTIEDNGQGFDVATTLALPRGRGLHNQQRRAQSIGGTVTWRSGSGGTQFTLWLPLVRRKEPCSIVA
ncbi:MAG: sensor histidine kinase [Pseudomonadota bacterium]